MACLAFFLLDVLDRALEFDVPEAFWFLLDLSEGGHGG